MYINEAWVDQVQEDYFLYLEELDPDICPMSYEAYEWLKIREFEEELAELNQ